MEYKQTKIFGKDEDGFYLGKIEDIHDDILFLSNREKDTFFNFKYKQIGFFKFSSMLGIPQLNKFNIDDFVIIEKRNGKVVNVKKEDKRNTFRQFR